MERLVKKRRELEIDRQLLLLPPVNLIGCMLNCNILFLCNLGQAFCETDGANAPARLRRTWMLPATHPHVAHHPLNISLTLIDQASFSNDSTVLDSCRLTYFEQSPPAETKVPHLIDPSASYKRFEFLRASCEYIDN